MPIVADNYNVNNATKGDHRKIRPSDLALLLNPQAQEFGVLAFTIAERKFAEAGDGRKGKGLKAFGVPWSDIDGWAHRQLEDSYFQLGLPTTDQVRKLYAHEIASSFASWVEVDPPRHPIYADRYDPGDEWRKSVLRCLDGIRPRPAVLMDSGRGCWSIWLHEEPLVGHELIEDINKRFNVLATAELGLIPLETKIDPVSNADRLCRMPGSVNLRTNRRATAWVHNDLPKISPESLDSIIVQLPTRPPAKKRARKPPENASSDPDADSAIRRMPFQAAVNAYRTFATDDNEYQAWLNISAGFKAAGGHFQAWQEWNSGDPDRSRHMSNDEAAAKWLDLPDRDITERTFWKTFGLVNAKTHGGKRSGSGRKPSEEGKNRRDQSNAAQLDRMLDEQAAGDWRDAVCQERTYVYWQHDFYERAAGWRIQDRQHLEREVYRHIDAIRQARGESGTTRVDDRTVKKFIKSLELRLLPPCVDIGLLSLRDRLKNYDLDTGTVFDGAAFQNGTVSIDARGRLEFREAQPRDWYTTCRLYEWPQDRPPRPGLLDEWLESRLPDPDTRRALWELLGATVLQKLGVEQRVLVLHGGGGTGKGTVMNVGKMLMGSGSTFTVTGGPARLASSQFATSGLLTASLMLLSEMPNPPVRGFALDNFFAGLSIIKSLSGGHDISIESKGQQQVTAAINCAIWMETNYSLSSWIQGDADAGAWVRRLFVIPFTREIPEERQLPGFELRFIPELPAIAWYAAAAYSEKVARGTWTENMEIVRARAELVRGKDVDINTYIRMMVVKTGTTSFVTRKDLRAHFAEVLNRVDITNRRAQELFHAIGNLEGVEETKRNGNMGFTGIDLKGANQRPSVL